MLASILAVPGFAAPPAEQEGSAISVEEALGATAPEMAGTKVGSTSELSDSSSMDDYTTFNGIKVPPLKEIEGDKFVETTKDGYWFVKHYSPYCGHCQAIAPTWQTLHEFYYVRISRILGDGYVLTMTRHRLQFKRKQRLNKIQGLRSTASNSSTTSTLAR